MIDEPMSRWISLPVLTDFLSVVHEWNDILKLYRKASLNILNDPGQGI